MKSKFSSVVKVKKQELDKAELELSKARARQRQNEETLMLAEAEYLSLVMPKEGNAMLLRQSLNYKAVAKQMKDLAQEKLRLSHQEINHYQHLYKKAHLNYEKLKYLEVEELKELEKKLKKEEEKALDEIATSKYFRERKRNEKA
ncbi:flagellar FliJ family protein [Campylobacter troglodytis]|uniref:flagellar FliJ family protein n=1 Tax=Campylobacter troglodytis TaxID=654363 RepID=UPI00115AD439|nr:flagellar FliJ family protein [Campylobacter troglodytis]TQR61509.1 hypothetical protein DMC01_00605 [Campylobacter troglodytis]